MTLPSRLVVVAGAAKTATTALCGALDAQPQFSSGVVKEPRYFGDIPDALAGPLVDRFNRTRCRTEAAYSANFSDDATTWVDGSTDYFNNPQSAEQIFDFGARHGIEIQVIVGLRDPVERAWSEHMHLVRNGVEPLEFFAALQAEQQRRSEGWIPLFGHVERSLYASGLAKFDRVFGTSLYVYRYEDLAKPDSDTHGDIAKFLKLSVPLELTERTNTSGRPRSAVVNTLVRSDSSALRTARSALSKRLSAQARLKILRSIDRVNLTRGPAPSDGAESWIRSATSSDQMQVQRLLAHRD